MRSCFTLKAKPAGTEPVLNKHRWLLRAAIHTGELPSEGTSQQGENTDLNTKAKTKIKDSMCIRTYVQQPCKRCKAP